MTEPNALVTTKVQVSESSLKSKALTQYRDQIAKQHLKCVGSGIQTIKNWIICGESLLEAKSLLPHGQFSDWIKENFHESTGLGKRTAQRYMRTAIQFRKFLRDHIESNESNAGLLTYLDKPSLEEFYTEINDRSARSLSNAPDPNSWVTHPQIIKAVDELLEGIECDPCSTSDPESPRIGQINYTVKDNGLADSSPWTHTAWVNPGHEGDMVPWFEKARNEMAKGNLRQAVLCLPENLLQLPDDLLLYPIALTTKPMTVTFHEKGTTISRPLPTRSIFIYLANKPNVARFTEAFRDIGVVFSPVRASPRTTLVVPKS